MDKEFAEAFKEEIEKEARTYKDRVDDDEKKKKRHFAFGGKKKSRHGSSGYGKGEEVDREFAEAFKEEIELEERKMTDAEMAEREEIGKKMKPKLQSFKDRYGDDAKKVMYATATKQAMEEVEIKEISMEAGKVYHQDSSDGKMFFKAVEQQKNKRWKGLVLDIGQKKPKNGSADEKLRFWKVTPDKDIPSVLKEEVELDEHCGVCGEQGIDEKKSATGYELYHKTFSDAMQHAYAHAKSKGFVVDKKEIDDKVATGPKKPSSGKTNRYSLKAGRKKVEIQVANLDNKRYELNMYIEEVELDEAFSMGKGDKRVVDAFYDQKEIKAHGASILTTDGKTLTKRGMGGQHIATWENGKIRIMAVSDVKSTEQILRYMKKSIPKNNFKPEDYKRFFEEMGNVAPTAPDSGGIQYQEPVLGQKKKKKKQTIDEAVQRTTFAGKDVFIVDSETFYNCRLGKKKYGRYEKYVGKGKVGQTIREYGLKYPRRPIILQNGESGPMLFLKYGRS